MLDVASTRCYRQQIYKASRRYSMNLAYCATRCKTVIDVDVASLRGVFAEIEQGANEGRKATGKSRTEHFGAAHYGWDRTRCASSSLRWYELARFR